MEVMKNGMDHILENFPNYFLYFTTLIVLFSQNEFCIIYCLCDFLEYRIPILKS